MDRTLAYLVAAVEEDLGDIAEVFGGSFIERAVNEGQARLEPDVLREQSAAISWVDFAATAALPADFHSVQSFVPDTASRYVNIGPYDIWADTLRFRDSQCVRAWAGTLLYRAHYPAITADQACLLPLAAADGLISYALYKAFRRLAAGRAEYKKYSTLVGGNAVSVSELEQTAQLHLQDFEDARKAGTHLPAPSFFYDS